MISLFRKQSPHSEQARHLETYLRAYSIHELLPDSRPDSRSDALPDSLSVSDLEPLHCGLCSSLHRRAPAREPDVSAFLYAALRLPDCISRVSRVVLGPTAEAFAAAGLPDVEAWPQVQSRARRRRYHYDGGHTLAVFVTSNTDLDDLIPSLCAFQIEWNKMHRLLNADGPDSALGQNLGHSLATGRTRAVEKGQEIRHCLGLGRPDWELLTQVWTEDWDQKWADVARSPLALEISRLPLDAGHFEDAAGQWWELIARRLDLKAAFSGDAMDARPLYLVSSNTHSLANLITGFAAAHEPELLSFLQRENPENIWRTWQDCRRDPDQNPADLLYYGLRLHQQRDPRVAAARLAWEESSGLDRHAPAQYPHLEVQRIAMNRLDPARLDSRLRWRPALARSRALIVNLDYPLGLAAGHVLARACELFPRLRGVFILGKSAAAIGRLGDIIIPGRVYDSHSHIQYRFQNSLSVRHLTPFLNQIAVFDDQKSITVRGTFLHGRDTVGHLLRDDFTGMEMEAGPFLAALYRHFSGQGRQGNMERDQVLNIEPPPGFSLGLLHYTSDTPYNIRPSLLSTRLGLTGLEAVYAASLAIVQRIMDLEAERLAAE